MPNAILTDFTYSGGLSTAPLRQSFLQVCSNALVAAGATEVDAYVIDASNDARIFSFPLQPTGTQHLRLRCSSSVLTWEMFETWDTTPNTGTGQSTSLSFNPLSGNLLIRAINHPECRGFNLYVDGIYSTRVLIGSPANRANNWGSQPHCLLMDTNINSLGGFYSATNPVNSPISRVVPVNTNGCNGNNAVTSNPRLAPGALLFNDNTGGQFVGAFSSDLALASGSVVNPIDTITADGMYRNIMATTAGSIMIRVA